MGVVVHHTLNTLHSIKKNRMRDVRLFGFAHNYSAIEKNVSQFGNSILRSIVCLGDNHIMFTLSTDSAEHQPEEVCHDCLTPNIDAFHRLDSRKQVVAVGPIQTCGQRLSLNCRIASCIPQREHRSSP